MVPREAMEKKQSIVTEVYSYVVVKLLEWVGNVNEVDVEVVDTY